MKKKRELYYKRWNYNFRKRDKDFLLLLHENRNRVLTYSLIEEYIWKDKLMSMSALKTFIKELIKDYLLIWLLIYHKKVIN